jgi:hypothetical protein
VRLLLNIAYEHLRGDARHTGECVPGRPTKDCPLCDFHQRLDAPVLPSEVAEEQAIQAKVDAINRARFPG